MLRNSQGEKKGAGGSQKNTDVGDEAKDADEKGPKQGIGYADQPEAQAGNCSEDDIDDELHAEIAANPTACIFDRRGRDMHTSPAGQAYPTVAQIFAAHQHEGKKDDDCKGSRKGMNKRRDGAVCEIDDRLFWGLYPHGDGLVGLDRNLIFARVGDGPRPAPNVWSGGIGECRRCCRCNPAAKLSAFFRQHSKGIAEASCGVKM